MPKKLINTRVIGSVVGNQIMLTGILMATTIPVAGYYKSSDLFPLIYSTLITLVSGFIITQVTKRNKNDEVKKRDGFLIVAVGWLSMTIFGSLPYVLSGAIPNYTDAFFETISGLTTTGATILEDIEAMPEGILFWRSTTHWIGGMGDYRARNRHLALVGYWWDATICCRSSRAKCR